MEPKPLVCPYCGSRVYVWSQDPIVECDDLDCGAEWDKYGNVIRVP